MSSSRSSDKSSYEDLLGESWVDVGSSVSSVSNFSHLSGGDQCTTGGTETPSSAVTHQLNVEDYLRLLREAQRESNQSSARVSPTESRRDSPRSSPKSPPNSPVQGTPMNLEWQSYYMNAEALAEVKDVSEAELFTDWSSRPDQQPPKSWSFRAPKRDLLSIRYARVGNTNVFSRKGLCTLFLTNLISLILGTGVGLWLSKHGFFVPSVKIR